MKILLFFTLLFFFSLAQAHSRLFTQHVISGTSAKTNRNDIFGNYNDAASSAISILTVSGRENKSHLSIEMLTQEMPRL